MPHPDGVTCKNDTEHMDGKFFDYGTFVVSCMTSVISIATIVLLVYLHFRRRADGKSSLWTRSGTWPCMPIWATFAFRSAVFIFCLSVELYQLVGFGPLVFEAYTVWNFVLIILVFGLGAVTDACHLVQRRKTGAATKMGRTARVLAQVHYILVEIELPTSILVCIVVWGILVWSCPLLTFTSYCQHILNVVFMLSEFIISGMGINIQHILLLIAWALSYAVFHLILHACTGINVYPFMATQHIESALWYIGLLAVHAVIFLVFWGISVCRHKYCRCCKPHSDFDNFSLDMLDSEPKETHYSGLKDDGQP